jgi:hypothetical protein
MKTCAHPDCITRIHATNTSGVCRIHKHKQGCACRSCEREAGNRVRSRAEMVALGLLPPDAVIRGEVQPGPVYITREGERL